MTNETKPMPREVTSMTPEQAGEMLKATTAYLQSQELFVNIAIVVVEANGYYTVGNMPDSMMKTIFALYLARGGIEDADAVKVIDPETGKVHGTH
jgi:hypothetical protein